MFYHSSFLLEQVTVYKSCHDNQGRAMSLGDFFALSEKYQSLIEHYRAMPDGTPDEAEAKKVFKAAKIPCCTISGTFATPRANANLVQHSGLIAIDIDGKENQDLNMEQVKDALKVLPQVCYISYSVGGKGLFVIIRLQYAKRKAEYHTHQFMALQKDFKQMGITIDDSCGDLVRLRVLSYDPDPYINQAADPYTRFTKPPKRKKRYYDQAFMTETMTHVERLCNLIVAHQVDITTRRVQWRDVGLSLTSLGEDGRRFFHDCASQWPGYDPIDSDDFFSDTLSRRQQREAAGYPVLGIGTFFKMAREGLKAKSIEEDFGDIDLSKYEE